MTDSKKVRLGLRVPAKALKVFDDFRLAKQEELGVTRLSRDDYFVHAVLELGQLKAAVKGGKP